MRRRTWHRKCLLPLAAAAALAVVTSGGAMAETAAPSNVTETYQDWVVRCVAQPTAEDAANRYCEMVQDVRTREGGERVLAVVLAYAEDGRRAITFLTPLGLALPRGVELFVDSGEAALAKLIFSTCQQTGCLASAVVTDEMLAALRAGTALRARVYTHEGQPADLPTSLRGFADAHRRLLDLKG